MGKCVGSNGFTEGEAGYRSHPAILFKSRNEKPDMRVPKRWTNDGKLMELFTKL